MLRDSAVRLVFGAASAAVGRVVRAQQQPDTIETALHQVAAGIEAASRRAGRSLPPRLVAASKGQPAELVQAAHSCGVRHFGENYVQELQSKARELKGLVNIRWHYIGRLQRRTAKKLVEVPGLWMVETVDSCKSAKRLNQRWGDTLRNDSPLLVMLQVNTSGDESKHGCVAEACADLGQYVIEECPHLKLTGLMTIGRQYQSISPNPDFMKLLWCREVLCQQARCADLELSMGMTNDYEHAIELGSTSVRIGRAIFSHRL